MPITRRQFLEKAGLTLAANTLVSPPAVSAVKKRQLGLTRQEDWSLVRQQFNLSPEYIHLAPFYIVSHPKPVRKAIEKYRRAIDANPVYTVDPGVFGAHGMVGVQGTDANYLTQKVRAAAARYTGGKTEEIALTDSTTMGLGLVYNGLALKPGQEILTTIHDFYPHHEAIRFAAERAGTSVRKIALFDHFDTISEEDIIQRIRKAMRTNTRIIGITWVHSQSGVKLPIRGIAEAVREINRDRDDADRALLIVDGVHGFGVEDDNIAEMGCDIFIAGTHKWMFGPRGTGIAWAAEPTWALLRPTIPSFIAHDLWDAWAHEHAPPGPTRASWMTPGGFHAFEHQWAMAEAFQFHQQIGRRRIAERTYQLNDQLKEGLAKMAKVKLHTPRGNRLSSGLVCFDVDGITPVQVVARLGERKIIITKTPYGVSYARIAPCIWNTPEEIDRALREIRILAA